MNSTLQDIMGLLKRYAVKTPTDADYMVIAGHTSRGVLVPQPGLEPNVITVGGLKDHILKYATLQQVVDTGNTIQLSTTTSKGIDITLIDLATVYQNGVSVTVPIQTGIYPAFNPGPDAFIANINGQNPGNLTGFVGGFVVEAHGDDNACFYTTMYSDALNSVGFVSRSNDLHTGDHFVARKSIAGVRTDIFKVANNGDTTANKFIKIGGTSSQFLMANGSTSTMPTLQQVVTAGPVVNDSTITLAMDPYISNPVLVISGDNVPTGLINITMNDGACINAYANDGTTIIAGSLDGTALSAISNEGTGVSAQSTGTSGTALYVNGSYRGITVTNGGISISGTAHGATTYQLSLSANSAAKPSTNTWTVTSDSRVKTNINPYTKGLETILAINPITYDYNGKAGFDPTSINNIGIIAQDVLNIIPESINTYHAILNEDDKEKTELYNFDSHALTFILINAVKQLSAEIELLKTQITNK